MNYDAIFDAKPRCLWEDSYLLERLCAIKVKSKMSVLDIASGTGRLMTPFGRDFVALDKDVDMLALNPAKYKRQGNYETLKLFQGEEFDLLTFLFGVIKDQDEFQMILNQSHRLLKHGGKFFGVVLSKGRLDSFIHPELYKWGDFQTFSKDEITGMVAKAGLTQRFDRTVGMTASVFDVAEKILSARQLDGFIRWYMKRQAGDLDVPFLRWHYVVFEAFKR